MSLPAVLQHLAVLEGSGLVASEKIGRVRMCRIEPEVLSLVEQWINARGVFSICMRSPDGQDFWSRGSYIEISPPDRLVFTSGVAVGDSKKYTALTTVTFEVEGAGTRMTVHQAYDIHDETYLFAVEGAPEGWRTTLDKLEREVMRIQSPQGRPSFTRPSLCSAFMTPRRRKCFTPSRTRPPRPAGSKAATDIRRLNAKWMSAPAAANA
jgi:DNA-binding transcriptional ArsR family regulator